MDKSVAASGTPSSKDSQGLVSEFDIVTDDYGKIIEAMRDKVRDPSDESHGRPMLPLQEDVGEQHLELTLAERGFQKGVMRIRRYDLRFTHYQTPGGRCYDVSKFGLYEDSKLVDIGEVDLRVGLSTLTEAVNFLASSESTEKNEVRFPLYVLCVVICEAMKLDLLSRVFACVFKSGSQVLLSHWMLRLMNLWEDLSKDLLAPDMHYKTKDCVYYMPDPDNPLHDDVRRLIGVTCQDVARCLGILRRKSPQNADSVLSQPGEPIRGIPLAEIYSILVYINGRKRGRVYGSIKVSDGYCAYELFGRGPEDSESVESNGNLSLQDPGFIECDDFITMKLNLIEQDSNLEISNGDLFFSNHGGCLSFDSRLSCLIRGENGYAVVFYTVFQKGMQVMVETRLMINDDVGRNSSGATCVCGRIAVGSSEFAYSAEHFKKHYMTTLFDAPVDESMPSCTEESGECKRGKMIELGGPFPLSRSVVALSVDWPLFVDVDLKTCLGEPIVSGSKEWMPRKKGTSEGIIQSQDGAYTLHIKLTWREHKW